MTTKAKKSDITVPVLATDKEKLQQQLRDAILLIDKKLDELSGEKAVKLSTNFNGMAFYYDGMVANLQINPSTESGLPNLIIFASKIRSFIQNYNDAAEAAGLKSYPACVYGGYNAAQLLSFVEARIKTVGNSTVITQLKNERKKLETFLSEDDRLATTLQNAMNLIQENKIN